MTWTCPFERLFEVAIGRLAAEATLKAPQKECSFMSCGTHHDGTDAARPHWPLGSQVAELSLTLNSSATSSAAMSAIGMFRQLSALHLSGLRVSKNNWRSLNQT